MSKSSSFPLWKEHSRFLTRFLSLLPSSLSSQDFSRVTLAFFSLSGIAVLDNNIDYVTLIRAEKWINAMRVDAKQRGVSGFHGSSMLRVANESLDNVDVTCVNDVDETKDESKLAKDQSVRFLHSNEHPGHVAMTYSALASLKVVKYLKHKHRSKMETKNLDEMTKDPKECVEASDLFSDQSLKRSIAQGISELQQNNGGFISCLEGGEVDPRFVYCALASLALLEVDIESYIDVDAAVNYLLSCISYEGAFGQAPYLEAHGGSTFCSVAALHLMNRLGELKGSRRAKLVRWLVNRFDEREKGFAGRPNKPADTCYAFWIGATLKLLHPNNSEWDDFVLRCQDFVKSTADPFTGGLAKWPDEENAADPLHTFLGLAGLAVVHHPQLKAHHPALNVVLDALKSDGKNKHEHKRKQEMCNGAQSDLPNKVNNEKAGDSK